MWKLGINDAAMHLAWSPDGTVLAVVTQPGALPENSVMEVNVSTGKVSTLIQRNQHDLFGAPRYALDGESIYLSVMSVNPSGLWSLDRTDKNMVYVGPGFEIALAPGGTYTATVLAPIAGRPDTAWTIRVEGAQSASIPISSTLDIAFDRLSWSPNGHYLAYSYSADIPGPPREPGPLRLFATVDELPLYWPDDASGYVEPSWSPDGNYLAVLQPVNPTGSGRLVIWNLANGCRETLGTVEELLHPVWAPQTNQIAFIYKFDVYIVELQAARDAGWLQEVCEN